MSLDNLGKLVVVRDHDMADADTSERLRHYIIERRREAGLTQEQASKRAGIPLSTWGTIESKRATIPTPENLLAVAKGIGVPVLSLMRIIDGKSPELSPEEGVLSNLIGSLTPDGKKLVLDWLTRPQEQRAMIELALQSFLAGLKPQR